MPRSGLVADQLPLVSAVALCILLFLWPRQTVAGGILHTFPPRLQDETFAVARVQVLLSRVLITISESSIEYRIDQTFFNDNDFPLDGLFVLPMADQREIQEPRIGVNGVPASFRVVSGASFFPKLRDLTEGIKDPSLLGLAGKSVLVVQPVTIGIRQQKSFRVEYKTDFSTDDDLLELLVPLDGERYCLGPVGNLEIQVRFKLSRSVRTVFSPTHHISVLREAPHRCLVSTRSKKYRPRDDFRLVAMLSGQDLDVRLLTHRSPGEKGTFAAFIEPPIMRTSTEAPDKDVVFLMDCSGSMDSSSLAAAKHAMIFGLESLRPRDRFNVVAVKTRPIGLARRLIAATRENIAQAMGFVNAAHAGGGTDLYNSFMGALEQLGPRRRPGMIVFAGHGHGTVGVTEPETIVEDIKRRNRAKARIFALTIGIRSDVGVLNRLATTNGGNCYHFSGKDDLSSVVNRLFAGVAPPLVSDLSVEFQDVSVEGVSPDSIPDLFGSDGALILGRYDEKGDTISKVRLKGRIKGRMKTVNSTVVFPEKDTNRPYLPMLWAMRRIGRLLEKESLKGPEPEVRQQISALAREFGFKTPFDRYASSLDLRPPAAQRDLGGLFWLFKSSGVVSDVESDRCKRVDDSVFYMDKGAWTDTRYRSSMPVRTVQFLSDEYFSLVRQDASLGKYMALGPDVVLVRNNCALVITSQGSGHAAR